MKKAISLVLTLALVLCMIPSAFAASSEATEAADELNALGVFSGTGTDANGKPIYDLDRAPTRQEAVTMLVRLLGKEKEAEAGTWETPFTDVDKWAKPYVGYAYANKLTSGTGATTFGGSATMSATQYLTLVLRALGYESGTDFQWDKAWELSDKIGMTDGQYNASSNNFLRGDVAQISLAALSASEKDSTVTLAERLLENSAIEMSAALLAGVAPDTKTLKHTIKANEHNFYHMDFSELAALIPNAKYAASLILSNAPKNIDELIAASKHMTSLLRNEEPWQGNLDFGQNAMEKMFPVTLLFSDKNTLCGYMASEPTKLDNQHFEVEFVLCDYSFSELTKTIKTEYENIKLAPVDIADAKNLDVAYFLPYSQMSDKLYIESNIDTVLCNLWLQFRSFSKYEISLGGHRTMPISNYEPFTTGMFENWKDNSFNGNACTVYLLLDSNKVPIGYTIVSEEKEAEAKAKLPQRDDDETFFGDKALKEYLLSLNPSSCELNLRGEVDQYYYEDRFIAEELYDGIVKYIDCIEVEEDSGKSSMPFFGIRVSCTDDDYYGRNVCVQTFSQDGLFYSKIFYIRLPNR